MKMKAVRFLGLHDVKIVDDMPIPVPTGEQVLIKVAGAGVCHSDLHVIDDGIVPGPFTLGHENAGYVEAMGESVKGFKKGDAVVYMVLGDVGIVSHANNLLRTTVITMRVRLQVED
ncbi:alcohol dehydrogenase catalytic domain-containing protein [Myroides odoratimimus]|uniref:alcohol dehydrogenase catalytic domain-containing protein n=1 Tax=Myroides odoratimimus TaxID=76832 RepID=UPI002576459B|nr:alcohol dehydrogenase catalytic domain-containing protein [Myroides odoratimimus]